MKTEIKHTTREKLTDIGLSVLFGVTLAVTICLGIELAFQLLNK